MRRFIWCYCFNDGSVSPIGDAKTYERAIKLSDSDYPEKFKLFELIEVTELPQG